MYVKACKNLRFLDCGSDLKKSRMSQHVGAICLTRNGPKAVAKRLNGQNLWGMWLGSPLKPTKRISTDFGLSANWILRLWPCPHSSKSPQTSPVLHIKQGLVEDLAKYEKCMKHGSKWSSIYQLSGQRVAWPICFKDINIYSGMHWTSCARAGDIVKGSISRIATRLGPRRSFNPRCFGHRALDYNQVILTLISFI